MKELVLNKDELLETARLLEFVKGRWVSADDPDFLFEAPLLGRRLPVRVQGFLNRFRREEGGYCLVRGHAVDDSGIGSTPAHWNALAEPSPTLDHDLLLVLYSALLGDVFGWATQQDGKLVHDVLPIKGMEGEQLGCGSEELLTWEPFGNSLLSSA
ncbi:MAG: hypothetical protein ACRDN9_12480 [Streptosporangiaceae bacterium]